MITIRRAEVADAVALAPRLRDADLRECIAAAGVHPSFFLPQSIATGDPSWALIDEETGDCVGLFGVNPVDQHPYFGLVWMLTSDAIFRHKKQVLRESPVWLGKLHKDFPLLGNHIDARNRTHVRWLKWLGFSFLRTIPEYGPEKRPFHEFAKLRTQLCVP